MVRASRGRAGEQVAAMAADAQSCWESEWCQAGAKKLGLVEGCSGRCSLLGTSSWPCMQSGFLRLEKGLKLAKVWYACKWWMTRRVELGQCQHLQPQGRMCGLGWSGEPSCAWQCRGT